MSNCTLTNQWGVSDRNLVGKAKTIRYLIHWYCDLEYFAWETIIHISEHPHEPSSCHYQKWMVTWILSFQLPLTLFHKICYAIADENSHTKLFTTIRCCANIPFCYRFCFASLSSYISHTGSSAIPFIHSTKSFANSTKTTMDLLTLVAWNSWFKYQLILPVWL